MMENYKGWDITLNWDNKDDLLKGTSKSFFSNQKEKWMGVHLNGKKIYGSSLKEIRHIIAGREDGGIFTNKWMHRQNISFHFRVY